MKLYTFPGAPNPRRVHIYLAEKGIEIPFEKVDLLKGANRTPEFLSCVNVMGGLPVLELDDGSHIAESVSICRYFEATTPEPPLFGVGAKEIARTDMWLRRIELNFMMPVGMVWIHGNPMTKSPNRKQIPEVADQNRTVVARYFDFLNTQLADRDFLTGPNFSIADITCLCTMDFASRLNDLKHEPKHANLQRWHDSVSSRPSALA